ncbi:MAG: RluA family pseudouridine synthase [Rhodospirillales bacterium]|nr:RluA family pseudouridine synthase [Alphaproteobacteria bacterium]USO04330.1 MAG: RluA family pseudouridine synthase [Rhodospirillales bacterium]
MSGGVQHVEVSRDDDGQRLDRWLQKQGLPFFIIQKVIRKGQVRVDGKRAKANQRLVAGQDVRVPPFVPQDKDAKPELSEADRAFIKSLVIYDEGGIVALNKPAGLATQGGTNIRHHIDGMLDGLADKDGVRPRLVHRLDKDTSGLLLLARSAEMARELGRIFQGHHIRKIYWAVTVPAPEMNEGTIRAPLRKAGAPGNEKTIVDPEDGQEATTLFEVVERAGKKAAFVAFWPRTGRTHQVRVHAAYMNCPLLGDGKYGGRAASLDGLDLVRRVHLHARQISFFHPVSQKRISIQAPLPPDLQKTWATLGFDARGGDRVFADIQLSR